MSEMNEKNVIAENLAVLATPDGFQKYILGTKKNGTPRAVYDIVKDMTKPKKKKKKKGKKSNYPSSVYDVYLTGKKKKKKKKHKKNKHWRIQNF